MFTCNGQDPQISHSTNVLQTKVSDLGAPAKEERAESQHGGDVTHANVTDVNTPTTTWLN